VRSTIERTFARLSQETCPKPLRASCSPRERTRRAGAPSIKLLLDPFRGQVGRSFSLLTSPLLIATDHDSSTRVRRLLVRILSLTILAFLTVSASSCSSKSNSPTAPRSVIDELGRSVQVSAQPKRIVSLAPSTTEILFAIGAGERVVGVTSYCDFPPEAREKAPVGDTLKPNVETIVALRADLVIISTASQVEASFRKLEELGIPVFVTNPRNIDGVVASIDKLGELIGSQDRARRLSEELRSKILAVEDRVADAHRPSVLVILGTEPLITVGARSFINDLINRAGASSISAEEDADYPQYSIETVIAKQPEIILLQTGGNELTARLQQTPAARTNRVYHIDDDLLLRPGPRIIDGLEQLAARIHPELFKQGNAESER
jgi:iron complex transport system substrate-binding protein